MDRIGHVGLSLHGSDVAGLEALRRPDAEGAELFLRELADALGASELVFLATCNRVEAVFAREEGELPGPADVRRVATELAVPGADVDALCEQLIVRAGLDAARHLFRVTASLDSLVLGEDQILAQVRDAYGVASDAGLVGPLLGPLFHHALAVGKQVRSETDLARHPVSVVNLGAGALAERDDASTLQVAVLGVGEMGRLMVRALTASGTPPRFVVNRTVDNARALAADCGAEAISLDDFRAGRCAVDALVAATACPGELLSAELLSDLGARTPSGRPLLAVDLAVPRDLPGVSDANVQVVDLDALRGQAEANRALRAEAAVAAERLVERKVATWGRRHQEGVTAPLVGDLQQTTRELLEKELSGLLGGRLAHLSDEDRRALERWARGTFGKLMHQPVAALKRLAVELRESPPGRGGIDESEREPQPS